MPTSFPGMDPFIESSDWEDFHTRFITAVSDALVSVVRPDYAVRAERRIYVEHPDDAPKNHRTNVAVFKTDDDDSDTMQIRQSTVNYDIHPVDCQLPSPIEIVETYLVIRHLGTGNIVTVIEVLSPSNKRLAGEGRTVYLRKREEILNSHANLVEVDLLRGGARLPTVQPLPTGDFYVFVCRPARRRIASVYAWPLEHPLPTIPIPLAPDDREVKLNLQEVFANVYDRAGYDYSLNYRKPIWPPLYDQQTEWGAKLLEKQTKKP